MTQTIEDLYGWGSWESIRYHAQRWAWCVKHREPYGGGWCTAGFTYYCESCHREWLDELEKDLNDDRAV